MSGWESVWWERQEKKSEKSKKPVDVLIRI